MNDTLKQRIRNHLKKNEGVKDQPYKDSNGNLTVGVGFNVSNEANFINLKFQVKDTATGRLRDATTDEKREEFKRLSKMADTAILDDTNRFTLPEAEMDAKLDEKIAEHEAGVKRQIGEADWNKLTDGQKTAVLDVHYANPGGLDNFGKLKQAIKDGKVEDMVKESVFHGGDIKGTPHKVRNFDRIRRNRAELQGIDPESDQAYKDVADAFPDHPRLPPNYRKHLSSPPQSQPHSGAAPGTAGTPASGDASPQQNKGADASDLLQGGEGNDTLVGGGGNDKVSEPAQQPTGPSEQNKSDGPADPRAASLVQMASAPVTDPGRAAALKPVEKLTEAEMKDMIGTAQTGFRGWRSGDPLKAHLYEKVQDWHVNVYGDAPQQVDGGKPVEPKPIRAIAQEPSPHATPQGEDLWQATGRLGQKVADAGATDGFDDAVKALQRGINMLNQAQPLPPRSPAYGPYTKLGPVTEDGKYGPQTDFALKQATARLGAPKVEEAFALGRFNTFARNAQRNGSADGVEAKTHSIFGPLFRSPDAKAPKIEGGVLQETLNSIGPRHHDDWEPLKVDNWIGPKTTDAFGRVLKAEDPDEVTTAFGRGLGLL